MSDRLIREFRAQLTTTMDSALRRIVFEIMNVFENSLHDHQIELTQKGEEIVQLKMKLQKAEVSVKEHEPSERGQENKATQVEREPEAVPSTPEHKSEVPEIDFEGTVFKLVKWPLHKYVWLTYVASSLLFVSGFVQYLMTGVLHWVVRL